MKLLLSFLCLSFAIASAGDSRKLDLSCFQDGFIKGLQGKKIVSTGYPESLATKNGFSAGEALRAQKLKKEVPGEFQFDTPIDFFSWIISYQAAVAHRNQIEQEMLLAALGCRVSIKTKADYEKTT